MNFSAASSSSAVVTPGRALRESSVWQRARIFPASAILSSSSGDFLMITEQRIRIGGRQTADGGRRSAQHGADPLVALQPADLATDQLERLDRYLVLRRELSGATRVDGPDLAGLDPGDRARPGDDEVGHIAAREGSALVRGAAQVDDVHAPGERAVARWAARLA